MKRITAVPGNTVDGHGRLREDSGGGSGTFYNRMKGIRTLGPDEYFLMGDNRDISLDSRHLGPVDIGHIGGRVAWIYFSMVPRGLPRLERDVAAASDLLVAGVRKPSGRS